MKLIHNAQVQQRAARPRRVWPMSDIFNKKIEPLEWTQKDEIALTIWCNLIARYPGGDPHHNQWAEKIANDIMDLLEGDK